MRDSFRPFPVLPPLPAAPCHPWRSPATVSVGNNEDSPPTMGGSDVSGSKCDGAGSVTKHVQLVPDVRQPEPLAARDVLDDDEPRPHSPDDVGVVPPERRLLPANASLGSGAGDVLAGEASADEIHIGIVSRSRDILEPRDGGPVLREHAATEWVDLTLPEHRPEPGALEAEL